MTFAGLDTYQYKDHKPCRALAGMTTGTEGKKDFVWQLSDKEFIHDLQSNADSEEPMTGSAHSAFNISL